MTITNEEMNRLLLPLAKLPGLDPVGLRVAVEGCGVGIVVEPDDAEPENRHGEWIVYPIGGWPETEPYISHDALSVKASEMAIDLADAATRDRVARWAAGRAGETSGCTAPSFRRGYEGLYGFLGTMGRVVFGVRDTAEEAGLIGRSVQDPHGSHHVGGIAVPGLVVLDEEDRRALPDGSLYRDARALALVAQHLGQP